MSGVLLISVHFHDGRYHGAGDWPPSPARLFQALVAAAALPGLDDTKREALKWLEELDAPIITAPAMRTGQAFSLFVPNNDLDAKGGDIRRLAEIRSATKRIRPRLFETSIPFLYVWHFHGDDIHAKRICTISDGLYQLGRGVDMAWAMAEILDEAEAENRLTDYRGVVYRPSENGSSAVLDCPDDDSLKSLEDRYKAGTQRFRRVKDGRIVRTEFANAPKPRFRSVANNSPATHLLFDIRRTADAGSPFASWPLKKAAALVLKLRDGAVAKLTQKNLTKYFDAGTVNRVLVGRDATEADKALRVRIVPLPSIGHAQVDRSIRRVLVEVPPDCPIRADDMVWAFSGLVTASHGINVETGETTAEDYSIEQLVSADDDSQLKHYGIGAGAISSRLWRSVTPLALSVVRGHIAPAQVKGRQTKSGEERQAENRSAIHAVMQALHHAGLRHRVASVRVQRESFEARGERSGAFANDTRFSKHQLWHVEIQFAEAVSGPLVLGNGRYGGLGLMAPVQQVEGVLAFRIVDGLTADAEPLQLARALRRAVMTRVQNEMGARKKLPVFFTGHESDGSTARRGGHVHLAFVPDLARQRLLVIAPHAIEHREPFKDECGHLETLARALTGLSELRAGRAGKLELDRVEVNPDADPLFASSRVWAVATPYAPTRHAKRNGRDSLHEDVLQELQRRRLPVPLTVEEKGANLLLRFKVAVPGPVLLGKTMHFGGGLFKSA
jgi:CRISPR-associated protein Csb2